MSENNFNLRPFGVLEKFYAENSDSSVLRLMEDCRNPELNTISHQTMANMIEEGERPYLVIDCRFDYEYNGGHIEGAINLNTPEAMEKFFFSDKERIQNLMASKTAIVFHCEFSQHRGPKMYRALRELDRRMHIDFYP